ncbi:MAG: protein kinase [Rariglobus sp.]|nr:protein kinase [Rariglobus sp.]
MTSPNTPPPGQPDPAALLALGLATQAADGNASSAPPLTPAELSSEFPRLDILELLGRGGMGAVYKARQRDLDRLVALKILRPGLDSDPGFAERFTREARALARLNHPGIVTLYEFGKTSAGRYFILMEFVDGVNLRQLLAAGRLSPREALAIVPPLCDALQYAHDRGLIHRDIKPENLLIDRLGRVKIADFGIAKIATGQFQTSTSVEIAGTPAYMAPEQRDRPTEVDHRADLYALGVVFYQMLTGELPAAGQLQPPSTRVQLDVRLDEIVLRALEKDPARRYAAATDFKTQIETVANTSAPVSSVASISTDNGVSYRSRRTLLGLPLLHIATGVDPVTGKRRIARGIVAIGDHAQGVFAFGGVAIGGVSFGGVSLGLFSYGGLALGLLVHGGLGIGALASFAGLAIAPIALGGSALGWYAYGGAAWGRHVNSPSRHDPAAVDFFGTWAREFTQIGGTVTSLLFVAGFALMIFAIAWARKRATGGAVPARTADQTASSPPLLPASVLVFFLVCFCGSLQFAAEHFPERVAVHFNLAGHPDGWAERGVALLVFLMIGVGVSFFIPCLFALLRFLPREFINLPNQGFWLAPQRVAFTHARLLCAGFWIAAFNAAFFWGLQILSHWAHLSTPPRFPMAALWVLTGLFLTAITLWIVRLIRTFSRPELAANPPAPSRLSRALRPAAPWLLMFLIFTGILVPVGTALTILRTHQAAATPATDARAWNLDVIVTDQSSWPPKTLTSDRTLPIAAAALSLLGSCEARQPGSLADWQAAGAVPGLRLEYPRATEAKMPDVIVVSLPLSSGVIWTRKADRITRHSAFSFEAASKLGALLKPAEAGIPMSFRFGDTHELTLTRGQRPGGYDLDTDKFIAFTPHAGLQGPEMAPRWLLESGVDLIIDSNSYAPGVLFTGTSMQDVKSTVWDAPADTVISHVKKPTDGLMTFLPVPDFGKPPDTRVYGTPQGGIILVQLLRATDEGSVQLRYKAVRSVLAESQKPPQLRALDWLDHVKSGVGAAWLPTGETKPEKDWLPPASTLEGPTPPAGTDIPRYLCLWLSHPDFDPLSIVEVTFADPVTRETLGTGFSATGFNAGPRPGEGNSWISTTRSPGMFGKIPAQVEVRLRYSVGEWSAWNTLPFGEKGSRAFGGGLSVGEPVQDADGRSSIELTRDTTFDGENDQFDFVAVTRDGRRLERTGGSKRAVSGTTITERFRFAAPLSQIRALEIRKRPILQTTWTVPLKIDTPKEPLVIEIPSDGTARINGRPFATDALRAELARFAHQYPGHAVVLRPSLTTSAASITTVLQACADAGLARVALDQSPPPPPAP